MAGPPQSLGVSRSPLLQPDKPPGEPVAVDVTELQVARCRPGLPTVATLTCSCTALLIASSPQNVKNRLASIPSMRAPWAMGQLEHQPRQRHRLHPGPGQTDRLTREVQPVVADSQ